MNPSGGASVDFCARATALVAFLWPVVLRGASPSVAMDSFDMHTIQTAHLRVQLFRPDGARPFYTGQRFNRGGIVAAVEVGGRVFFGPWQPDMSPGKHDAITGPADEFDIRHPPFYDEAQPGEPFVKIGVGLLRRRDEQPYQFWTQYEELDSGRWTVETEERSVRFRHVLQGGAFGYVLEKTVALADDAPVMTWAYRLENTGARPLKTSHYHHNFFVFEGVETLGPEWSLTLAYPPEVLESRSPAFTLSGRELRIEPLVGGRSAWISLSGTPDPQRHRFRVFHRGVGMGVEVQGDRPLEKMNVYAQHRALCPEPFVRLEVAPGESVTWSVSYRFIVEAPVPTAEPPFPEPRDPQ